MSKATLDAPAKTEEKISPLLKMVLELGPLVVFFFANSRGEWLAAHFPPARLADFGHLGDGGLHFNLAWPHDAPALDAAAVARLREGINAIVVALGGSFSAEHGVGPQIQAAYWQFSDAATLELAGGIEALMNPRRSLGLTRFGPPDAKT